jgi:hypothetical protein
VCVIVFFPDVLKGLTDNEDFKKGVEGQKGLQGDPMAQWRKVREEFGMDPHLFFSVLSIIFFSSRCSAVLSTYIRAVVFHLVCDVVSLTFSSDSSTLCILSSFSLFYPYPVEIPPLSLPVILHSDSSSLSSGHSPL